MSDLRIRRRFAVFLGIVLWSSFWTGFGATLQGSESSSEEEEAASITARCKELRREQRRAMTARAGMPNQGRETVSPLMVIACWILDG